MKTFLRWLAAKLLGRTRVALLTEIYQTVFAYTLSLKTSPLSAENKPIGWENAPSERIGLTIEGQSGDLVNAPFVTALYAPQTPCLWNGNDDVTLGGDMRVLGVLFHPDKAKTRVAAATQFSNN